MVVVVVVIVIVIMEELFNVKGHGNSNEGVVVSFSDNDGGMNRAIGSSPASLNDGGVGSSMNSGNAVIPAQ